MGVWWETPSQSDCISVATLLVSVIGVVIAVVTLRDSNKNASATTVSALTAGLNDAWRNLLVSDKKTYDFSMAELFNAIELACAVEAQKSLIGNSGKLIRQYIYDIIQLLAADDVVPRKFKEAMSEPDHFEYTRKFQNRYKTRPNK